MLSRALTDWLVENFGGNARDYKVKSTNHGTTFVMNGRRYVCVFDSNTARRIYNYDRTYTRTRSKSQARSGVKPFKTRLMIEATQLLPKPEPLTEERKTYLRSLRGKEKAGHVYAPKAKTGTRRELSL